MPQRPAFAPSPRHPFFPPVRALMVKELKSLWRDHVLLLLIIWAFTGAIYAAAAGVSKELHNAPIAVVDHDHSALSARILAAIQPPQFLPPRVVDWSDVDTLLDKGEVSFALVIPPNFQADLTARRSTEIALWIDATVMTQAFLGQTYLTQIVSDEITRWAEGRVPLPPQPVDLVVRVRFNPNLTGKWFGGVMEIINMVTILTVVLVGAALIREREHGTVEHLLVLPLRPSQILLAKIFANGIVVLLGVTVSLVWVVRGALGVPIAWESIARFLLAAALFQFAAASLGVLLATIARSMPQFGLLVILVVIPLQLLSGAVTPRESMPEVVQRMMLAAPNTYFVRLAQGLLYRNAPLDVVWSDLAMTLVLGALFFALALKRFRASLR